MIARPARYHLACPLRRVIAAIALFLALAGGFAPTSAARGATLAAAPAPCHAADLDAAISHGGAGGGFFVWFDVTVIRPDLACTLVGQPQLQLWDAGGNLLVASPPPDPDAGQPITLSDGVGGRVTFRWDNWGYSPSTCKNLPQAPWPRLRH